MKTEMDKSAICGAEKEFRILKRSAGENKELTGKENVVASNQGLQTASQHKESLHKEMTLGKTKAGVSIPSLSDEKLAKISSNSLVNTSFDMGAVVENIFEESMVLDGDEECCPTGF